MKYVSLDLETTCLEPQIPENIMGISMVIEDSAVDIPLYELPHFTCLVNHKVFSGSAFALHMNAWILKMLIDKKSPYPIYEEAEWPMLAMDFLTHHFGDNKLNLAVKNVAIFDYQFLPKPIQKRFNYQMIDPGSVFVDWSTEKLQGLDRIKKRTGFDAPVTHNMYEDALDVIGVLRTTYPQITF